MADFALWISACETALWPPGTFWTAYCGNLGEAVESVIEADPIAAAVRIMMATRKEWIGTATELLGVLIEIASERDVKAQSWPGSPRALAGRVRRAATFLRKVGVDISFGRDGRERSRLIYMIAQSSSPENEEVQPSAPSATKAIPSGKRFGPP